MRYVGASDYKPIVPYGYKHVLPCIYKHIVLCDFKPIMLPLTCRCGDHGMAGDFEKGASIEFFFMGGIGLEPMTPGL
jgi:hypothetical protein